MMMMIWNQAVTAVSWSASRLVSSSSDDKYLWIAKVSNWYVCDICQNVWLADSKIEKRVDDKTYFLNCFHYPQPETIR